MARSLNVPPFPDSPGAWLACNRYRKVGPRGEHLSPEQLGSLLGVSGATVRRWESGRSLPTNQDLARFEEVCELTPIEAEFLQLAFNARSEESPPQHETFHASAYELLDTSAPTLLLDSLYYLRGYNRIATLIFEETLPELGANFLVPVLRLNFGRQAEGLVDEDRVQHLMHEIWLSTAFLCGSAPYRRFLADLRLVPGFERRWRAMALEPMHDVLSVHARNEPYYVTEPRFGTFRVRQSRVTIPPIYQVCEFIASDERALEALHGLRTECGGCRVSLSPMIHWACDGLKVRP